jgi:hypothetical protein
VVGGLSGITWNIMEQSGSNTHSFIIKIWLEETLAEDGRTIWRGHITHVPGSERRYFKDLDEVAIFIFPYLQQMGVKPNWTLRIKHWLRRRKSV